MIEIDGSFGEGGGQIVRTALALSSITGKAFTVRDIRKGRDNPGLKNQHLFAIKALKDLCFAEVVGENLGSMSLDFYPKRIRGKTIDIDIKTAGSMTLLLQAMLLPCMFAEKNTRVKIRGGSDVAWSMPVDYFKHVFLPQTRRYSRVDFKLERRGYYPKGAGKIEVKVVVRLHKEDAKDMFLEYVNMNSSKIDLVRRGELLMIKGISHASDMLSGVQVAERQANAAAQKLRPLGVPVRIDSVYTDTLSRGSGITIWAIFSKDSLETDFLNPIILGADALGKVGVRAEMVGQTAASRLLEEIESGAVVDMHMADNLIPFIALFGGRIKTSKVTAHTLSNIYVCEKFLDVKIKVEDNMITNNI